MGKAARHLSFFILAFAFLASFLWAGGKKPRSSSKGMPASPVSYPFQDDLTGQASFKDGPVYGTPVYLSELENLNEFDLFANGGGWDGNWYVGYNTCWVQELPAPPPGRYVRAYLGAKLGRMKTETIPGRPSWETRSMKGEIHIAVAPEPLWPQSRRFLLTETKNIPLDGAEGDAVEGVGQSRWFWAEVPLNYLSFQGKNYVALYSPSRKLKDSKHAPILAAGRGNNKKNTWLNSTVKGEPPFRKQDALKTAVSYFEPAIAIKLISQNQRKVRVEFHNLSPGLLEMEERFVLTCTIEGKDVDRAWVEFSTDTRNWHQATDLLWGPPFDFTLKRDNFPLGDNQIRVVGVDIMENRGISDIVNVYVHAPSSEPGPAPEGDQKTKR